MKRSEIGNETFRGRERTEMRQCVKEKGKGRNQDERKINR